MEVITIIIAAVIAIGVSYAFFIIQKRDNNLEKVKRYADRRQDEFKKFFDEQIGKVQEMKADLETGNMQAEAAVKRFEKRFEEFKVLTSGVEKDSKSVQQIEQKIRSYDNALEELVNMTAGVEQNLELVRKESIVIDEFFKKLNAQKQSIENIEKHIPQLAEHFDKTNQDHLKVLGNKLLEEYKKENERFILENNQRGEKLKKNLELLEQDANKAFTTFQNEISSVYAQASEKADKLEDEAFKHLSMQAKARSDNYTKQMNDMISQNQKAVEEKVKEFQNNIDSSVKSLQLNMDSSLKGTVASSEGKLAEFNQKYETIYKNLSQKYDQKSAELDAAINGKTKEVQDGYKTAMNQIAENIKTKLAELDASYKEKIEKLGLTYTTKIDQFSKEYDEKTKAFQEKYTATISSIDGKNDSRLEDLNQKIAANDAKFKEQMDSLNQHYLEKVNSIHVKYDNQLNDLAQLNGKKIAELEQDSDSMYSTLAQKIQEAQEKFDQSYLNEIDRYKASYDSKLASLQDAYDQRFNEIRDDYTSRLTQIDSETNLNIENLNNKYKDATSSLSAEIEKIQQIYNEQEGGLNDQLNERIETISRAFDDKIEEVKAKLNSSLASAQQTSAEIQKNVAEYNSQATGQIESFKNSVRDTLSAINHDVNENIQNAENSLERIKSETEKAFSKADQVEPVLNEKIEKIDRSIEEFKSQSQKRLIEMNQSIETAISELSSRCEVEQSKILTGVDSSLEAYRKDLEYRLNKIESSGADVDYLEKNLKTAMEEIESRVLKEFTQFTDEQAKRHEQFSTSLKNNSDVLEKQLQAIENNIENLKVSAIGSMSEKLKGFEENFDADLKKRGEAIEEQLVDWKSGFDAKMEGIEQNYENQRKEIEADYTEEFREKVKNMLLRSEEQNQRIEGQLSKTEDEVQNQIVQLKKLVADFSGEIQDKIDRTSQESEIYLKENADKSQRNINAQLQNLKNDMLKDLQTFEEAVKTDQESGTALIQSSLNEFETWKGQLSGQLEETKAIFTDELNNFRANADRKVEEASKQMIEDIQSYTEAALRQQTDIQSSIDSLDENTKYSVREFEKRSDEIMENLKSMYDSMLTETEEKIRSQSSEATRKISELNTTIQNTAEKTRADQTAFVMKMQNDVNTMQGLMNSLSKELQSVKSQMGEYEKAETMKKQLDEKISGLEDDFKRINSYRVVADELNAQYNNLLKLKDGVEHRIADFEKEQQHVEQIGQKYEKMIGLSNAIDSKISSLSTTSDEIQSLHVSVRDYKDSVEQVSLKYDKLEQKQQVVDRITKDVDNAFTQLTNIEQRLKSCASQSETLPDEIRLVQKNVDEILKNGPKITDAISRLSELDQLLKDADSRMEQIASNRQGIGRSEQRLAELSKSIDDRFKQLQLITREDVSKTPPGGNSHIAPQSRETIITLKKQGWSIPEIAKRMKMSLAEVELILELEE